VYNFYTIALAFDNLGEPATGQVLKMSVPWGESERKPR
jgi:hypothetical protein